MSKNRDPNPMQKTQRPKPEIHIYVLGLWALVFWVWVFWASVFWESVFGLRFGLYFFQSLMTSTRCPKTEDRSQKTKVQSPNNKYTYISGFFWALGFWVSGLWASGFGLWTSVFGLRTQLRSLVAGLGATCFVYLVTVPFGSTAHLGILQACQFVGQLMVLPFQILSGSPKLCSRQYEEVIIKW